MDQSDNLNYYFFVCVVISDLYLLQEIVVLIPCFTFCKNLILSLIDNDNWNIKFSIICLNGAPVICFAAMSGIGGLGSGLPGTAGVINSSDIIHSFEHEKSSSISQLIEN